MTSKKPRKFPKTDQKENRAVNILKYLIINDRVKPDINTQDKIPNHDGYIELLDENEYPFGKICVQVKGLNDKYLNPPKIQVYTSYFAYAKVVNLPFLIIGVDCVNEKAYWYHIKRDEIKGIENQDSKVIQFPDQNIIDGSTSSYLEEWERIIKEDKNKIDFYDELFEEKENLLNLVKFFKDSELGVKKSDFKCMHLFLDEINYLLDNPFNIIKKKIFNEPWKIGLIYFILSNKKFGYSLFPIPWNKNDVLIKQGNEKLWGELQKQGLDEILYDQQDIIKNFPNKIAKKWIFDHLTFLIEKKLLDNQCCEVLVDEYVYAFINRFYKEMGLEKKKNYSLNEITEGFYLHLPLWIQAAVTIILKKSPDRFKKIEDLYFRTPYLDPSMLEFLLSYEDKKKIDAIIKIKIRSNDYEIPEYIVGNPAYSFAEFHKNILFLRSNNIHNINQMYKKTGYKGEKPHSIFEEFSDDDIFSNLNLFFKKIFEVFPKLVWKNFPKLKYDFDIYRNCNKVIIFHEINKKALHSNHCPLNVDIFFLRSEKEESQESVLDIIPKSEDTFKEFKGKRHGDFLSYKYKRYILEYGRSMVFTTLFEETPLLNYSYNLIMEFTDEYFGEIIEWYDQGMKGFLIGIDHLKDKRELIGLIEKNVYDAKNALNRITIGTKEGKYEILVDGTDLGFIQPGQQLRFKFSDDANGEIITNVKIIKFYQSRKL